MLRVFKGFAVSTCCVAGLVACGGGGSVDDGTVPLSVTPKEIVLRSAHCQGSGTGPRIMISGGVEPYTIHNPFPEWILLSSTYVDQAGDTVQVSVRGGACLDTVPLTVTDADANTVEFTFTHEDSSSE